MPRALRAPSGLCAASSSASRPSGRRRRSSRPGHDSVREPADDGRPRDGDSSASSASRTVAATAALSTWWCPRKRQAGHPRSDRLPARRAIGACAFSGDAPRSPRRADSSMRPTTTGTPGLMMPAFSIAISRERSSQVLLVVESDRRDGRDQRHQARWSRRGGRRGPTSQTAISTSARRNSSNATAVVTSKNVG